MRITVFFCICSRDVWCLHSEKPVHTKRAHTCMHEYARAHSPKKTYRNRKTVSHYLSSGAILLDILLYFYSFLVKIINEKRNDLTRQRLTCYIHRHILPSNHVFLLLLKRKKTKWKTERAGVVISWVHPKAQNAISSFYFIFGKIYSTFCPFRLYIHTFTTAHRFFLTLSLSLSLLFGICGACFLFRFAFYFVLNIDFDMTEITFFQDHKSSRIKWALSTFSRCLSQEISFKIQTVFREHCEIFVMTSINKADTHYCLEIAL